jgi:hypothetical protein
VTGAEFDGVDIDLLADYIGGALDGTPDQTAVAALIAGDPAWRAAYESLGGAMALVGTELGRMDPAPMPADLADRLDAMFTSGVPEPAVPHLALVPGEPASGDGAPRVPGKVGARRGRRMRWAAPIAVAAGVVAFVGFGLDYLAGRESSNSTESSAGSADQGAPVDSRAAGRAAPPRTDQIFASGTDYSTTMLGREPVHPLTAPERDSPSSRVPKSTPGLAAADDGALQRLSLGSALQDCLEAIGRENAAGPISVQSVDYARFNKAPAVIVRFTAANGAWGWASGPACGTPGGDADTLGKVPVR